MPCTGISLTRLRRAQPGPFPSIQFVMLRLTRPQLQRCPWRQVLHCNTRPGRFRWRQWRSQQVSNLQTAEDMLCSVASRRSVAAPYRCSPGSPRAVRFTGRWEKGTGFMPLRTGKAVGYDADLMAFKFTMRNGQQIVQCQISTAALSDLADRRRGSKGDLLAEFKAHRGLIEAIASALFDRSSNEETRAVSIFSKHIPTSRYGRRHSTTRGRN